MTLWRTKDDEYAVCDGPGPQGVVGYIVQLPKGGGWIIQGDALNRHFLDHQSAAATVLDRPFPEDLHSYFIERDGEQRAVLTYPDVIGNIKVDGWTVLMADKP